jgi:hypothetical protein
MSNRMLFWVLVVVGIIIILVSVFAHQLGIGSSGFGIKKIIGVIVGVIVALGGVWGIVSANR